jgi:hypothetical protein
MAANITGIRARSCAPIFFGNQSEPPVSFDVGSFDPVLML